MIKLQPNEVMVTGHWLVENGQASRDESCERIEWLISNHLLKIADSPQWGAWETLYRDPDDCRYWERTFPSSEMHGGGPPQLRCLEAAEAEGKYINLQR